jgi:flagellar biosynthesis component FlhA
MTLALAAWGFLKGVPREVWLILAALAALWAWGNHREAAGRQEGRAEVQAKWDKANKEAAARQAKSATQATVERVTETRTIYVKQKARNDAIQATDDGKPSAASLAVNCVRLSEAGTDVSQFPACGRRESSPEAPAKP